jgi:hypothetical protein
MPGSTSLGITFPCETEAITMAAIQSNASTIEAAIATVDTVATAAIQPPAAYVRVAAGFGLTAGASAPVAFDTERYDRGGFWTIASPTLLTLPTNGSYLATARLARLTNAGNFFSLRGAILVAGVERGYQRIEHATLTVDGPFEVVAFIPSATAGQTVTVNALYTGTATATILCSLSITYVSTT